MSDAELFEAMKSASDDPKVMGFVYSAPRAQGRRKLSIDWMKYRLVDKQQTIMVPVKGINGADMLRQHIEHHKIECSIEECWTTKAPIVPVYDEIKDRWVGEFKSFSPELTALILKPIQK